ncbi:MAG: zinc chelation protein SecC [Methylococcaceae bacterium]|nr:zinc chelation protein SecC [Methylococcaceae bacterium]
MASPPLCPCGSGLNLAECCGPYLSGTAAAPTPEALMRSRYTAYALGSGDYLIATWHPSTRPAQLGLEPKATRWLKLEILEAPPHSEDAGEVDFTADFFAEGSLQTLHETSHFRRESGRWYYLDGKAMWERHKPPGRNDPCWCGSGKKFKKCCGG